MYFGFKHSKESRLKMSLSHIGIPTGRKGIPRTEECKSKISIANTGIIRSEEFKKRVSQTLKIKYKTQKHPMTGRKLSENTKRKIKNWGLSHRDIQLQNAKKGHKACQRISSIELKLQNKLKENNIEFLTQWEYELGFIDIFIKPNICICVDGDYWHNYPFGTKKDQRQNNWLKNHGYKVIRIWEHEINEDSNYCLDKIRGVKNSS